MIVAVSGLFAGGLAVFGWQWLGFTDIIKEGMTEITSEFPQAAAIIATPWVQILALAVYGLPFVGMLYASIMLLFRIKSPSWHPGLVIFIVWMITVIAFCILIAATVVSGTTTV
jgi:hypothetical protein